MKHFILGVVLFTATASAFATCGNSCTPTSTPVSSTSRANSSSSAASISSSRSSSSAGSASTATGGSSSVSGISQSTVINTVDPNGASAQVDSAKITAAAIKEAADSGARNTPNLLAPALTSSNDTCMGSSSGGVALPGFGISGGSTWTDENCKLLKNSRELWNMGMKAAAIAMLCRDPAIKESLEVTGYQCPARKPQSQYQDAPVTNSSPFFTSK